MGKIKQRNWLLIITGVLVIPSAIILIMMTRRSLGIGVCSYDGIEYQEGQIISNYQGRNDCYCSRIGEIVCEENEVVMSYDDFTSDDLQFAYSFRNFLEKQNPDLFRVVLSDINYQGQKLEIIVEREALCSQGSLPPVQTALYKKQEESLILTTITNRDESLYDRVCLIGNSFVIEGIDLSEKSDYSVYYQDEKGQEFELNSCFLNGKLYGEGDVFKDTENDLVCTCESSGVECEDL